MIDPCCSGRAALLTFVTLATLSACGPDPRSVMGDAGPAVGALRIEPDHASISIANGNVPSQAYKAYVREPDGTDRDVTSDVVFTLDKGTLGTISGSTLQPTGIAGPYVIAGQYHDTFASADGKIFVDHRTVIAPAPSNAAALFDAATDDVLRPPTIMYPSAATVFPPNLGDFDVHWQGATSQTLFEIAIQGPYATVRVYTQSLSAYVFTPAEWAILADSTRGRSMTVRVRAIDPGTPTVAGKREIDTILADQDVVGGIYYWSEGATAVGIFRHDFANASAPVEAYYTSGNSVNGWCVACHALSSNGTKIAVSSSQTGVGGIVDLGYTLNAASRAPMSPTDRSVVWDFATFNPDASLMATVFAGQLTLRDGSTEAPIAQVPTAPANFVTHPDWSPTGDKLAYTALNGSWGNDLSVGPNCRIAVRGFDVATRQFGTPTEIVPGSATSCAYYPNFSPDGAWIVYDQSGHGTYADDSAMVSIVPSDGSSPGVTLATPNVAGARNSWPRWAPFQQTLTFTDSAGMVHSEPIMWLTFSSTRAFGTRAPAGRPQIWMTPFFPARKHAGLEPSAPAFRLPFQDLTSNNHAAQWTQQVVVIQ